MTSGSPHDKRRTAVLRALSLVKATGRLGIGSGSTMAMFLEELSRMTTAEGNPFSVVPSSSQVEVECSRLGISLSSLYDDPRLEIVIDSADEVDSNMNLLKGGGAALTREKVLHSSGDAIVIVVEEDKVVTRLGEKHPLPIEVLPFALPMLKREIEGVFSVKTNIRYLPGKAGPLVTDNGNYILDIHLGAIENPAEVNARLKSFPGVIETGIFPARNGFLVVGKDSGAEVLEMRPAPDVKVGVAHHGK